MGCLPTSSTNNSKKYTIDNSNIKSSRPNQPQQKNALKNQLQSQSPQLFKIFQTAIDNQPNPQSTQNNPQKQLTSTNNNDPNPKPTIPSSTAIATANGTTSTTHLHKNPSSSQQRKTTHNSPIVVSQQLPNNVIIPDVKHQTGLSEIEENNYTDEITVYGKGSLSRQQSFKKINANIVNSGVNANTNVNAVHLPNQTTSSLNRAEIMQKSSQIESPSVMSEKGSPSRIPSKIPNSMGRLEMIAEQDQLKQEGLIVEKENPSNTSISHHNHHLPKGHSQLLTLKPIDSIEVKGSELREKLQAQGVHEEQKRGKDDIVVQKGRKNTTTVIKTNPLLPEQQTANDTINQTAHNRQENPQNQQTETNKSTKPFLSSLTSNNFLSQTPMKQQQQPIVGLQDQYYYIIKDLKIDLKQDHHDANQLSFST